MQGNNLIRPEDLERAKQDDKDPLCDESNLQVFRFWYEMGGLNRPPTILEAAETPATLARDFIFLLNRMRQLAATEADFERGAPMHLKQSPKLPWG